MTAITLIGDDESATESDNSDMARPQTPINVSNSAAPSTPLMNTIVTHDDHVSELTEAVTGSPTMPATDLQDANIGIPSSPQARAFMAITLDRVDAGYDSDGYIGPSFEAVEGEGELVDNEEEMVSVVSEVDTVTTVDAQLTEE